ncbi:hypothetical protein VTK73DRAFT_9030 [Phialemonium thermophilum]|uniref:Uncharacterized protein n=1 Tax=Phialemonium thermophilum TaxID=223376 RepID=A0ABR3XMU0_9PEZI
MAKVGSLPIRIRDLRDILILEGTRAMKDSRTSKDSLTLTDHPTLRLSRVIIWFRDLMVHSPRLRRPMYRRHRMIHPHHLLPVHLLPAHLLRIHLRQVHLLQAHISLVLMVRPLLCMVPSLNPSMGKTSLPPTDKGRPRRTTTRLYTDRNLPFRMARVRPRLHLLMDGLPNISIHNTIQALMKVSITLRSRTASFRITVMVLLIMEYTAHRLPLFIIRACLFPMHIRHTIQLRMAHSRTTHLLMDMNNTNQCPKNQFSMAVIHPDSLNSLILPQFHLIEATMLLALELSLKDAFLRGRTSQAMQHRRHNQPVWGVRHHSELAQLQLVINIHQPSSRSPNHRLLHFKRLRLTEPERQQ